MDFCKNAQLNAYINLNHKMEHRCYMAAACQCELIPG
jgi:hypothetical protein